MYTQKFTVEELAEMPSCNLAESIHNKWLQSSGNSGGDLYVATVDDFVRGFLQVVNYYQFLKGDVGGTGPTKKELKLRLAERRAKQTGNPLVLEDPMMDMPGAEEFCTRVPCMAGEEVFGSTKRKADLPLGAEEESHRPDKVNFSHPRASSRAVRTRSTDMPIIIEEEDSNVPEVAPPAPHADDIVPSPIPVGRISHVTAVEETRVNVKEWHIARLPKTSAKCCWAQRAVTKKKCTERIVRGAKSTPAPTYTGLWHSTRRNVKETTEFFFCSDDIHRCVKGSRRKWVVQYSAEQERPSIPDVWPVKLGTNLKQCEILALEAAGFQLPQKVPVSPRRLFSTAPSPANLDSVPVPADADRYPGKREGKLVKRTATRPNPQQRLSMGSADSLKAQLRSVTMIPHPGHGCIIALDSMTPPDVTQYHITISSLPGCTCPAFKKTMTNFRGRSQFSYCKHVYYIFLKVCHRNPDVDLFIHAPTFSFNEVKVILESGILTHPLDRA
jgi:hypothetical protein